MLCCDHAAFLTSTVTVAVLWLYLGNLSHASTLGSVSLRADTPQPRGYHRGPSPRSCLSSFISRSAPDRNADKIGHRVLRLKGGFESDTLTALKDLQLHVREQLAADGVIRGKVDEGDEGFSRDDEESRDEQKEGKAKDEEAEEEEDDARLYTKADEGLEESEPCADPPTWTKGTKDSIVPDDFATIKVSRQQTQLLRRDHSGALLKLS
jgi:hypothetical protein